MSLLELKNISLKYKNKKSETVILDEFDFSLDAGQFCVLLGEGSSGKTSFLNLICSINKADGGEIIFEEKDITNLKKSALAKFLRGKLSFVRHGGNLFNELTVRENYTLYTRYSESALNLKNTLKVVGLADKEESYPSELSYSERLKLSVALAIASKPSLILCDDPITGLDDKDAQLVIRLLVQASHEMGVSVIFATNNSSIATVADTTITVRKVEIKESETDE